MLGNMRRLHPRGAANRGVCVDAEGAMLGPDCVLVHRTPGGFRGLARNDAARLQKCALNADCDAEWLFRQSQRIADALNKGEITLAQIYGLHIPVGELTERQLCSLALARLAKDGFDPDEPRVPAGSGRESGEWTNGGGGDGSDASSDDGGGAAEDNGGGDDSGSDSGAGETSGTPTGGASEASNGPGDHGNGEAPQTAHDAMSADIGSSDNRNEQEASDDAPIKWELKPLEAVPSEGALPANSPITAPAGTTGAIGAESITSLLGQLPPETLEALSEIALRLSAAAVVFQILFLPSNGGTAVEGTVPNAPGLAYRYDPDTGVLRLSQGGADGTVTALGEFHVGLDGRFYDASGNAVGRPLPDGGVVVDTTALPGYRSSSAADAEARAGSVAVTDTNEPKLCPDPSVESVVGRSERSLAYQEQITGLPRGLEVMLNGIRFDGCRESDGTMLEAKGPGFANMMNGPTDWKDWFTGRESLEDQMRRQSNVARAAGKTVEWHVAERPVAGLFRDFAATNKLSNIIVIYTPLRQP